MSEREDPVEYFMEHVGGTILSAEDVARIQAHIKGLEQGNDQLRRTVEMQIYRRQS